MNEHDLSPADAAGTLVELFDRALRLPKPTDEELAARDAARLAASERLISDGARRDARLRYETSCPKDFLESDWEYPDIQPFRTQIESVLNYKLGPKGILASGPTGRRKTGAMWALMKRLTCEEGRDVRFYSAFEFFSILQEQVKYGHDDARGWIEAVARRPIVFIDDYGQQSLLKSREDWAESWFFRFLDIRAGERLPLFVTTNMSGEQIAGQKDLRGNPLLRRLLLVCEAVQFLTDEEKRERRQKRK